LTNSNSDNRRGADDDDDDDDESLLTMAILTLQTLLKVTPSQHVQNWYSNVKSGFVFQQQQHHDDDEDDGEQEGHNTHMMEVDDGNDLLNDDADRPSYSVGGLFVVCLLLELFEGLQFTRWNRTDNPMHPHWILDAPTKTNGRTSASAAVPSWYMPSVSLLQQIGRTVGGMKLLRSRVMDGRGEDWMGNTLDVSIRHLHSLAMHWEDTLLQSGMVFDSVSTQERQRTIGNDSGSDDTNNCLHNRRRQQHVLRYERGNLQYAVEGWVRLWHQVLLFVHQNQAQQQDRQQQQQQPNSSMVSFRSLSLDLQDYYTSAYAMLVSSDATRPEIKAMIRLQLEELSLDEEEHEELKISST
jgi:hypothetical protein